MTTPTLHQAAQVALDALEPLSAYGRVGTRDVDQAALQQVCAALREALAQPQAEPVDQQIESINAVFDAWRNGEDASMTLALSAPPADGDRVEAAIDDYIDGYVMEGDDGYYQPNDGDTAMLKDAMMGLLVDPGFLAAYDGTPPAAPQAVPAPAVPEGNAIKKPIGDQTAPGGSTATTATMDGFPATNGASCSDSAPAVREPLTDEQLAKIAVEDEFLLYCDQDSFNEIARAIEQAHGITGGGNE